MALNLSTFSLEERLILYLTLIINAIMLSGHIPQSLCHPHPEGP